MKKSEVKDAVLEFIERNPGNDVEAIKNGTGASDILVRGAIKALLNEDAIVDDGESGAYRLQSKSQEIEEAQEKPNSKKVETKSAEKKEDEDLGHKSSVFTGRDSTRYRLGENRQMSKGRCALLVLRVFAEKNPKISLNKLQEIFKSSELFPRFQLVEEVGKAKKFSQGNRHRFFLGVDDIFLVGPDKKKCAVCSQFTKEIMDKFLKIAAANPVGIKVKEEKEEAAA